MGLFSFNKGAGKSVFSTNEPAATPEKEQLKASELLNYVKQLGLAYQSIKVILRGDDVVVEGSVAKQSDSEKIVLALGNVAGVDVVDNKMSVSEPKPQSKFHTVASGDWLSKITEKYYGDAKKFNVIFEANQPMLKDPDEIYPGQILRIPNL